MAFILVTGRSLQAHGAYHEVVEVLNQQLQVTPDDVGLRFKLACAHQEHGDWKQALIECEQVRRLGAGSFELGLIEGLALAEGGHHAAAKQVLDEFLKSRPGNARALMARGRVLMSLERKPDAWSDFDLALRLEPAAPPAWWLDAALAGDPVAVLRRALGSHPDDPELLTASLRAEAEAGHTEEALLCVQALQRSAPRPEPWMARRAELLQSAGRREEALQVWEQLHRHLISLPNLERGTPLLAGILTQTEKALGLATPVAVTAPPASPCHP